MLPMRLLRFGQKIIETNNIFPQKSRILESKNLSTNADSNTDTTDDWSKNTPKLNFFF